MEDFVENLDRYPWITKRPVPAPRTELVSEEKDDSAFIFFESLPVDLELFYNATDGADLFGKGTLYSRETLENTARVSSGWRHLGAWADGSLLLFDDTVIRLWWTGFQWEYQVLATSFSDFMARLTAAQGSAYWEDENFVEPEITPIWREFRPPSPVQFYAAQALAKLQRQNARLRSMKLMRQDLFVIRPGLIGSRSRLPAALHSLYDVCDGFAQAGGFDIWPSERVTALPHTNSRWFEVGAAPGYRILFDAVADRGVAVIATAKGTLFQIARSFEDFLNAVDKAPQGLYWEWSASLSLPEFKEPPILWPDEKMDLRAASLDSPSE